ncbi:PREDICTED: inositol polyphosphate 5-phosphatase K-like [Priapulus caudatus]|uniref:Inositol polyphosphate 5-phosphatase K-like n=1 Tax=Priapulus caudatus TaxID=37621 RepID=A0ABM1ETN9_PRICU|nr:PREDICTED: inositol polyphosphate 5-phosphatase K-like [Priapulus caudatus]
MASQTFDLRFHLCTWNTGIQNPDSDSFTELLGLDADNLADIYAIGLQEISARVIPYVKSAFYDDVWTTKFKAVMQTFDYVKVKSIRLQGLLLLLFTRRRHLPFLRNVESTFTRTGFAGFWGNKGATSIRLAIYDRSICIVNCHLAAHHEACEERIEDYDMIMDNHCFKDVDTEQILDHDYVFMLGDLNFRIDDMGVDEIRKHIEQENYSKLLTYDQLNKCIAAEEAFEWFVEGPITFPPTYKFENETNTYDTSRRPAWCDRVLWYVADRDSVEVEARQEFYRSHPRYRCSDHRPVTALMSVTVAAPSDQQAVVFHPVERATVGETLTLSYTLLPGTPTSSWDWVGLYKSNFGDLNDYAVYVWTVTEAEGDCTLKLRIKNDTVPACYCLCYISSRLSCVLGVSSSFEIIPSAICSSAANQKPVLAATDSCEDLLQRGQPGL